MNKYDVIVIGAGNGGLTAAATTAKNGLKTLVLERNTVPGGSATSFRRGRFEFEASLHELCNVGTPENPGSVRKLFNELGADVDWCTEDTLFRTIADGEGGYDVTMPSGIEAFCKEMERQIPGSYESTKAVFDYAKKANAAVAYLSSGKPDPAVLMSEHADFLRMASHSTQECLDAMGMPKKAQSLLLTYWSYLGASAEELDFAYYAMVLERYVLYRPAFPKMRSHELSLAIEKVIKDNGGDIRYSAEVSEILVKDGKAYGVVVNGEEIFAEHIVANCYPEAAYGKFIKDSEVPEAAKKLTNARETGTLFFNVYLGLNRSAEEIGIKDYSVFLFDSSDVKEQYESIKNIDKSFMIGNCLNVAIPEASENGTCIISMTTMFTEEAWGEVKAEDYKKVKDRIAKRLISTYEKKLGVDISPYIEEISIAAPPTFARYLGSPNGTPYGYHIKDWDTMIVRTMNARGEIYIKNLYFTGAHAERAGGYSSTYANGQTVAKRILKELVQNGK